MVRDESVLDLDREIEDVCRAIASKLINVNQVETDSVFYENEYDSAFCCIAILVIEYLNDDCGIALNKNTIRGYFYGIVKSKLSGTMPDAESFEKAVDRFFYFIKERKIIDIERRK